MDFLHGYETRKFCWVLQERLRVQGSGFRVQGLGSKFKGSKLFRSKALKWYK
jgi:hypothetical protein